MIVKFKKLVSEAIIPSYAYPGEDAGLDLTTTGILETNNKYIEYGTGLAVEIPKGFVGLLFPRSSITKTDLQLKNSVGIIDSGYRNEIKCRFTYPGMAKNIYNIGDRIAQLIIIPYPQIEPEEVKELEDSKRGIGGYGSSGK